MSYVNEKKLDEKYISLFYFIIIAIMQQRKVSHFQPNDVDFLQIHNGLTQMYIKVLQ